MGASGAGKTTLLNVLCDRVMRSNKTKLTGDVMINDEIQVKQSNFGNYGAYVMQDDILFETLTCRECLVFAARLRLAKEEIKIQQRVDEIIASLGLNGCQNTLIGSQMIKGLSGGEKKRTAIGVELITNPKIIFLDEPTSGLDSFTAYKIVKLLKTQAERGKMIISTIHQPGSQTYGLFDRLILMADGHIIFQGKREDSVPYFNQMNLVCPKFSNPADYFLREFDVPYPRSEAVDTKFKMINEHY